MNAAKRTWTLLALLISITGLRADWPTYRHDAARSGYTSETLPALLQPVWFVRAPQPPQPAWPRSARLTFDRAFQPVVGDGAVYFGSSVDGAVYALEAETGARRWSFPTEAPVRFAPAFANHAVYVVSDDGYLYCLDARTGNLRWKRRGGPTDELVLGNERMISRWPARGGPVVLDGTVCFAAGLWPSDGIFVVALEARTGQARWVNDSADQIYMGQPHPGAFAHSGISPQGYLVATGAHLLVPNGRAIPAAFRTTDGAFQYFHLQSNGHRGGGTTVIADGAFLNDGLVYDLASGAAGRTVSRGALAALPGGLVQTVSNGMVQSRWIERARVNRKGQAERVRDLEEQFRFNGPGATSVVELIVAGPEVLLGLNQEVRRIRLDASNEVWRTTVEGAACGLAVADGALFVSTDQGVLYAFGRTESAASDASPHPLAPPPNAEEFAARAAAAILGRTAVTNGYCVDLGCGDGALADALARLAPDLRIVAVDADPARVALARARFERAGLLGRATALQRDPEHAALPPYCANLVVSCRSLTGPVTDALRAEALRVQRPYGGQLALGPLDRLQVEVRGPLAGAGNWTHQYADAANTLCSTDEAVRGPLGLLWFADVDQRLVQRHGRAPAPLFYEGILVSEGRDGIAAVDAYNGHKLWEVPLPGILDDYDGDHLMGSSGSGSNFALSEHGVYVRRETECLRLELQTGRTLDRFRAPPDRSGAPGRWGFLAYEDGILLGSLADPGHVVTFRYLKGGNLAGQLTESKTLFALDAIHGAIKWRYDAQHSLRHNAIAVGAGRVVLVDRPQALYDRVRGAKPPAGNADAGPAGAELVALDLRSGQVLWRNRYSIAGTVTVISEPHQKVLLAYQPTAFSLASELGGRMSCFDLSTGERVWDRKLVYKSRPVLNDRTIYAEGGAWDLLSGQAVPFSFKRSYGCGILAGARSLLVFRSATLGYFDLEHDCGTEEFGGIRPGCWINALPVGGIVLAPDGAAGCACSYPNESWIALRPDGVRPPRMTPAAGSSPRPLTVHLEASDPTTEQVRYTLDGSAPGTESPRYDQPFTVARTALVQARSFGPQGRTSRIVAGRFVIDPGVLELAPERWQTWDAPGAAPPSEWTFRSGEIHQAANTLVDGAEAMGKSPAAERPGTLYAYRPGQEFRDGEFRCEVQSADNDTVGVAFRLADADHHYLWSMDSERSFHALARKDGTNYTLLASNAEGYVPGQWYELRLVLAGPRLTVFVDGEKDLETEDARLAAGTIALYAWGNSGVTFRNATFRPGGRQR